VQTPIAEELAEVEPDLVGVTVVEEDYLDCSQLILFLKLMLY
jgi:hypothetical protein